MTCVLTFIKYILITLHENVANRSLPSLIILIFCIIKKGNLK